MLATRKIVVIGAGSWGTALAISLARGGRAVTLWARRKEAAMVMARERHNPTYLPDAVIPDTVAITSDLAQAVEAKSMWVFATPSQSVREVASGLAGYASSSLTLVSVAKGIENGTLLTTTQVLAQSVPRVPLSQIGVLYGPSHAEEVGRCMPTAVVAAAHSLAAAKTIQDTFMSSSLRVYLNLDVLGVEIAGSVKNILAIAAGMSDGVGYGDNAKAALITRGIAEIKRLGLAMGASGSTFAGLAGIGDLVVTCMSQLSRNRYLGEQIGKGRSLAEVEAEMTMVAEGVRTTASVHELAGKYGVEMPITEAVYSILFLGMKPESAVRELMNRLAKHEDWLPDFLDGEEPDDGSSEPLC